jgi:hypothetical protein
VRDCFFVGGSGEVMASNDGALHVWDPDPGQRLLNFESEASPFTAFRPLPNPFTLAAATQESVWYTRKYPPHLSKYMASTHTSPG